MGPRFRIVLALSNLALGCAVLPAVAGEADPAARPRLAVVISIDQFRADYLVRFRPFFGEGGFRRLIEHGALFENCYYRHAVTLTAPGHATILTGVHANVHRITSNEWLDRASWEMINSVEDGASPLVGITPAELGPVAAANPVKTGRSPLNLHAATVGDQLKAALGGKGKVFTASNKDRSAILLGGQKADGAYWDENGRMVTSRYYRDALPGWVEAFNAERRAHGFFGQTWDRLLDPAIYETTQGPDDAPGESDTAGLGRTFPRKVTGGKDAITPAFFTAFDNSPFSAEFLGEFVMRAVREEKLGRDEVTDLLGVSFSQIDAVGHSYGPDSHEMMDSVLRIDRVVARLLECLDREVGLNRCVIVFTADHGSTPLPERIQAERGAAAAGRVRIAELETAARKALDAAFGALPEGEYWFTRDNAGYHLRPTALAARGAEAAAAAKVVKAVLARFASIAEVYTREELMAASPDDESLLAGMRRSYRAESDRDVVYVLKPYFIGKSGTGTGHGAPYDYDTHVPLVWFGAGVPRGVRPERVGVDDLAPTLASLLAVPAPPEARGRRLF